MVVIQSKTNYVELKKIQVYLSSIILGNYKIHPCQQNVSKIKNVNGIINTMLIIL